MKVHQARHAGSLAALRESIALHAPAEGRNETAIAGLTVYKRSASTNPVSGWYPPGLGVIAQGAKRVTVGEHSLVCQAGDHLLTALDLPTTSQIVEASSARPYLAVLLALRPRDIADQLLGVERGRSEPRRAVPALAAGPLSGLMTDALTRLLALLETPCDIAALAPLIKQEIVYRLLTGEQGARLAMLAGPASERRHIGRAIAWLKQHYAQELRIDALAALVPMSRSTFQHHFKVVTSMSPLQYQKQLRLHEARRLMLTEGYAAATAAFEVGYQSASQFSREYARLFGASPRADITRWQDIPAPD
jgi:AraC-like DNA-binding protein